jgi:dephospho-CoA kinase
VVIIPLLFEKELQGEFSRIICVGCSLSKQAQRLRDRGLDELQLKARISSQWPVADKLKLAQVALWNEGTLETLERQVDDLVTAVIQ